jgi:membrane protease YdiL (CAAX protease family)
MGHTMNETRSVPSMVRAILKFPLVRIPLLGGILFLAMGISNGFMASNRESASTALALVLMMVGLALGIYWLFIRFVEERPVTELSLRGLGRELGVGLLLGFCLYAAVVALLGLLGYYRIEGLNPWMVILPVVPMAISSSVLEELIYRGVLFRVAEEYLGSWIALILSAVVFGAGHLGNPDATLVGAAFVAAEAGFLLIAAYMLTHRLWLPIGLHMSWNFTQAAIFSGSVSGVEMPPGLVKGVIEGPELLTGGKFGAEASIFAFLLCTAAGVVIFQFAAHRGRMVLSPWNRRPAVGKLPPDARETARSMRTKEP